MPLPIQTRNEILTKLREDIRQLNTDLNVGDHSVAYDISLRPASLLGEELWLLADFITRLQSLDGIVAMQGDENYKEKLRLLFQYDTVLEVEAFMSEMLDARVGNWNVTRLPAEKARAFVRFYGSDNTPITVDVGKRASTRGQNAVTYEVLDGCSAATPQYDDYAGLWYTELLCQATTGGTIGLVSENAITYLVDNISGVIQCRNPLPAFGGQNAESDVDLANRSKSVWQSWSLDTTGGLQAFFEGQPGVHDAYVAGPGNPLVGRTKAAGIPTDIFISSEPGPVEEVDVFVSTLAYPVTVREAIILEELVSQYASFAGQAYVPQCSTALTTSTTITYYPNKQPLINVLSVTGSTSSAMTFTVHTDDRAAYSGSVRAHSWVEIDIDYDVATEGELITITYIYDGSILALQNTIDSPQYNLMSQDLLVRSGKQISINLNLQITLLPGYSGATVQSVIEQDLIKLFAGGRASNGVWHARYQLGQRIDYSDAMAVIANVEGVDRVDFLQLSAKNQYILNYLELPMSEYARLGAINAWI